MARKYSYQVAIESVALLRWESLLEWMAIAESPPPSCFNKCRLLLYQSGSIDNKQKHEALKQFSSEFNRVGVILAKRLRRHQSRL